jgi:hypothetical protein
MEQLTSQSIRAAVAIRIGLSKTKEIRENNRYDLLVQLNTSQDPLILSFSRNLALARLPSKVAISASGYG